MSERELNLNSISRYAKQSPRLVLEAHSACEVPAGCGGVVLRWRRPDEPFPVRIDLFARGEHALFLDGSPLSAARPLVVPGEHVIAFRLARAASGERVLLFAAVPDEKVVVQPPATAPLAPAARILSRPDGSWRFTTIEPADDAWTRPGYDDSSWAPMIAARRPAADKRSMESYWIRRLRELGAQPIGVDALAPTVWVRKRFSLDPLPSGQTAGPPAPGPPGG